MRWLKIPLVVLILFGIYKYRTLLIESVFYSVSLKLNLIYAAFFVALSFLVAGWREKYIIEKLGGSVSLKTTVESILVSVSSIFSFIKMSTSISIYYLKRHGVRLSHATTAYIAERFYGILLSIILSALILGKFNAELALVLGVFGITAFLLIKQSHRFPELPIIKSAKKVGNELKKITRFKEIAVLFLGSLLMVVAGTLTFMALAPISFVLALTTIVFGDLVVGASPTPIGLGIYEVTMPLFLVSQGVANEVAVGAVLTYRFLTIWAPAIAGLLLVHRRL